MQRKWYLWYDMIFIIFTTQFELVDRNNPVWLSFSSTHLLFIAHWILMEIGRKFGYHSYIDIHEGRWYIVWCLQREIIHLEGFTSLKISYPSLEILMKFYRTADHIDLHEGWLLLPDAWIWIWLMLGHWNYDLIVCFTGNGFFFSLKVSLYL